MKIHHQHFSKLFGSLILMGCVSSQATQILTDDVDITGNIVTFGALVGQSAPNSVLPISGVTLQFSDISNAAKLDNILSRSQASWQWSRADSTISSAVPVMKLDSAGGLSLLNPANPTADATVKIDPRPGYISILPRLELPGQTNSSPAAVITRALGDDRYLLKDAAAYSAYNFGAGSWAANSGSMAFGPQARAKGGADPSFAMGSGAVAGLGSVDAGITLPAGTPPTGEGGGSIAIGLGAYATYYSMAFGVNSRASGYSTALGNDSKALAWASVALGGGQANGFSSLALGPAAYTFASGDYSAAIGYNVYASGTRAMALGTDSFALGYHSMALNGAWAHANNSVGFGPTVHAWYMDEFVVGTYPESNPFGTATTIQPTDPLFVVGNGTSTAPNNALVVRRNGDTEVKANFKIGQNATVSGSLAVTGKATLNDTTGTAGVTLDPTPGGVSSIRGVLRVRAGGDLDMGDFTAGGQP